MIPVRFQKVFLSSEEKKNQLQKGERDSKRAKYIL
jgi:hypothetical protein